MKSFAKVSTAPKEGQRKDHLGDHDGPRTTTNRVEAHSAEPAIPSLLPRCVYLAQYTSPVNTRVPVTPLSHIPQVSSSLCRPAASLSSPQVLPRRRSRLPTALLSRRSRSGKYSSCSDGRSARCTLHRLYSARALTRYSSITPGVCHRSRLRFGIPPSVRLFVPRITLSQLYIPLPCSVNGCLQPSAVPVTPNPYIALCHMLFLAHSV